MSYDVNRDIQNAINEANCIRGNSNINISQPTKYGKWIHTDFLISKILSMSTWLDGTVLVVSRDEVIDIIDEMKNNGEKK